jgi:hypothetical protein
MFEVFWFFLCGIKSLKRFMTCLVKKIILHREKVFTALGLGMLLFSLVMLFVLEERLKKVDTALQECEAKLAERAVEIVPVVVADKSLNYLDYGALTFLVFATIFILCLAVVSFRSTNGAKPPASEITKLSNSSIEEEVVTEMVGPSIDTLGGRRETDNSLIESSISLNDAPPQELVELTSVDPSTLVYEAITSPLVPELISYLDILS